MTDGHTTYRALVGQEAHGDRPFTLTLFWANGEKLERRFTNWKSRDAALKDFAGHATFMLSLGS